MEEKSYRVLDYFWRKVHRWHRRSPHDKALIIITIIAVIVTVFSICMFDSKNWTVPFIVAVVGCAWILLFTYANMRSCSEIPNNSDTISRQAAIDALKGCAIHCATPDSYHIDFDDAMRRINMLSSAQPERKKGK